MEQVKTTTATKKCQHCQKEIDSKAKRCPYCQGDLRPWMSRHPIWTTVLVIIILWIVGLMFNSNSNSGSNLMTNQTNQDSLLSQNRPTIKALSTVPSDYVGQSFDLYVTAKAANYYNYGFNDESSYYSLDLADGSTQYSTDDVYGYLVKNAANKTLMDQLINSSRVLKIHATIPESKWQSSSNAFLQIDSWSYVQ